MGTRSCCPLTSKEHLWHTHFCATKVAHEIGETPVSQHLRQYLIRSL